MYSLMGAARLAAESDHETPLTEIIDNGVRAAPDVGVLATRASEPDDHVGQIGQIDQVDHIAPVDPVDPVAPAPRRIAIMVWHYHDDDIAGPDAAVKLAIRNLPAEATQAKVTHYRIDQTHSNAYAEWQRMGSPVAPTEKQYAALQKASELATLEGESESAPARIAIANGVATLDFTLPRQAVSLLVVEW